MTSDAPFTPDTILPRRRLRLAALVLLALLVVASPTVLIVARADRGSASFGDTEVVGRNRVAAARLDIAVGERTVPIRADGLAPGDLVAGTVELVNDGTLLLRYALTVSATTTDGLATWLTWTFAPAQGDACPTAAGWRAGAPAGALVVDGDALADGRVVTLVGDPATGADPGDRTLDVGETDLLCIAAELSVDAPNAVQATVSELRFVALAEQVAEGMP